MLSINLPCTLKHSLDRAKFIANILHITCHYTYNPLTRCGSKTSTRSLGVRKHSIMNELAKPAKEGAITMSSCALPNIDPNIKHVGVSKLRGLNASKLKEHTEDTLVIQENDKPLAVLLSYDRFLEIKY